MDHHPNGDEANGDPARVGRWEMLGVEFDGAATHAALLPTNKVFAYGGSSLDATAFANPPPAEVLDLATMEKRTLPAAGVEGDLWCGGHTFLADGQLLFAGGTSAYPPQPDPFYGGLRQAYLFDPFAEHWIRLEDMHAGRWYPTLIRLANNSVLTIGGLQYRHPETKGERSMLKILFQMLVRVRARLVDVQEIYYPAHGHWETLPERRVFPLYPRFHLLPDGDVFYSGVFNTHYFVPGKYPSARWNHKTGAWVELGGRHHDKNREEGISLLLALRPPDYPAQVLIAGGGHHNLPRLIISLLHGLGKDALAKKLGRFATAKNSAERIDLSAPQPRWQAARPMHLARIHANGVLLPDGTVAVIGGMPGHGHGEIGANVGYPVLPSELYDPQADQWRLMATPQRPRVYHSSALLLPDGRVMSLGGNPQARVIEHSIEIFSPPYLFRGPRPQIVHAPQLIAYQNTFVVQTEAARQIAQVVLMRPEVVTHVTNTDQRLLELAFRALDGEQLEVQGPPGSAHMPAGYAMLFLLNQDGVPSLGHFLRVG